MSQIQIYIPYIRNNITRSIRLLFSKNIGTVVDAQMYSKMNEYERYYIALLQINLYDTTKAKELALNYIWKGGIVLSMMKRLDTGLEIVQQTTSSLKNIDDVTPVNASIYLWIM